MVLVVLVLTVMMLVVLTVVRRNGHALRHFSGLALPVVHCLRPWHGPWAKPLIGARCAGKMWTVAGIRAAAAKMTP